MGAYSVSHQCDDYPDDGGSKNLLNTDHFLQDYTAEDKSSLYVALTIIYLSFSFTVTLTDY